MARIAGVELPENKKIEFSLPVVFGIGRSTAKKIAEEVKVADTKVKDLSEGEISRIQKLVDSYTIEGDLRRQTQQNIRRLEEIGTYRGIRHKRNLPVRGQRTRSNARTKRGKKVTIGAMKRDNAPKAQKPVQEASNK